MDKLIKADKNYYQYEHHYHQWFKIVRKQCGTIMLMTDGHDCCLICDMDFNILHEIITENGGLSYVV